MSELRKNKGPWFHRALIFTFATLLGLLLYWLLGFVTKDIGAWPGPSYSELERRMLDPEQVAGLEELSTRIEEINRDIAADKRRQEVLRDSLGNSERTMNQLLELQRLTLQKGVTPTPAEQAALAQSQQLFLANQEKYQQINEKIAQQTEALNELESRKRARAKELQEQRQPVQKEYERLLGRHRLKLAAIKLAVLIPLLVVAVVLALKKRASIYAPLIYAYAIATLLKVLMVMHEHFPTRYFKYVLILAALVLVARILVYLLRMMAFPKRDWLLKQYREAYESFLCPVCGFPIRRGPLKFLAWNRRSLRRLALTPEAATGPEEPYVCPFCSTPLFEECGQCHAVRHALLPACTKCGQEKALPTAS